jgi:hypothetical protein
MHLDLAVAPRQAAEAAFFADGEAESDDDIPRIRLEGLSEFELAHLAMALVGQFEPRLALDGDCPEDIVSEADPRFVAALAALSPDRIPALLAAWAAALEAAASLPADPRRLPTAITALQELAALAARRRHGLLYTQSLDDYSLDPELD